MINSAMDERTNQDGSSGSKNVWLDMDQSALDAAYDQSVFAPNMRQVLGRYSANSAMVRERLGPPQCHAYGLAPIERLYVFPCGKTAAPIHIFFHGGAWSRGLAKDYAFPAELFVHAGAHYVVADFAPVQDTDGSLMPIAEQVRRSIAWIYHNAEIFGGDRTEIYISGFSSGAHLAGVILTTDWVQDFNLPVDIVKGGICCSGMFDLEPVRLSARSKYIRFTDETEQALSPQRNLEFLNTPLVVAYGTLESPEFQRQSCDFAGAVKAAGKSVQVLIGQGYNHFEILETLSNPYGLLGRAALEQMGLGPN
jgi:arylformamidase